MAFTAFINASLTTARGQNDTHPQLLTHIGCIVIPAVLALAEMGEAPDQLVLYALLVGHESIPRISRSLAEQNTLRIAGSGAGLLGRAAPERAADRYQPRIRAHRSRPEAAISR